MDPTAGALARLRRFARAMNPELPAVDVALEDVRRLLHAAGVPFKLVDGVAVVHHGYARTTEDIDVLVEPGDWSKLWQGLEASGFDRLSDSRLQHVATGVRVDLLAAGSPMPRAGGGVYPSPRDLPPSDRDPDVVGLGGLLELKLRARRHRDEADVVELLKRLGDGQYLAMEAEVSPALRHALFVLRRDALEELAQEASRGSGEPPESA